MSGKSWKRHLLGVTFPTSRRALAPLVLWLQGRGVGSLLLKAIYKQTEEMKAVDVTVRCCVFSVCLVEACCGRSSHWYRPAVLLCVPPLAHANIVRHTFLQKDRSPCLATAPPLHSSHDAMPGSPAV